MIGKSYQQGSVRSSGLLKIFFIIGLLLTSFILVAPNAFAALKLETIYHVYMDDVYIGAVTEEEVVEQAADRAIAKVNEKYKDYDLQIENEITYISEQVFRSNADNDAVSKQIEDMATVKAVATLITVDEKPITYVKDQSEAESVLKKIKLNYVTDKELKAIESKKKTEEKDENRVVDVRMKEDIHFKEEAVQPKQVLTVDKAVKLLQEGTLEDKKHKVKEGEAIERIAASYDLTTKEILKLNEGLTADGILQIGQEINTVVTEPLVHVVVEREMYEEEAVPFEREVIEDSSMPKGDTKEKQTGKNGTSGFTYKVIEQNGEQTSKKTIKEETIEKPVKQIVVKGTKVIPSRGTGKFTWPANGGYVSSKMGMRWGKLHKGIDIAGPSNYTIKAADHGIVVSAGWNNGGYGNKIVIDHQNGYQTIYAHLKSISVSAGQKVEKGSAIGIMGSTGDSTGIHLHFEVYKNGSMQNPLNYF
ncbi:peptidoglycan DD-metalloendopeptidase family protein [Lederbergia citrea]|uniref:Peptidoglycan DD-metalloendopeptidase family protein n=1 Tax=Lederbergia citrea TaxID=2833581 RepID=A0A942UQS1_9BACI|nr:M23 family metallopeptidase [Lederbergia citrea]MBS4223862.1 peptidoglycan DD-metalloendopeptidase family protein [Lederbergia citrea]